MPAKLASFAEDILNGLKDAALLLDENLLIENLNLAYCDLFGVSAEEVLGRSVLDLGHEPWQHEDLRQFLTNLQAGKPASHQLVLSHDSKESGRRILQFYGRRLDHWPLILLKCADVTEQEHTRHQRQEMINRMQALIRSSSDFVYRLSPDWSVVQSFVDDTSFSKNSWLEDYISPEERAEVQQTIEEAIRTRTDFELLHHTLCQDGSAVWMLTRAVPICNAEGRLVEWLGTTKDITESIESRAKLQESEQQFRTLADLCPVATIVNLNNRWVYANKAAAKLLGANRPDELIGLTPFDVIAPEYHGLVRQRIKDTLELAIGAPALEYRWRRLDGAPIDVEVVAGLTSWDGQPAVQVLVRDIRERKEFERALQQSEQRLQQLADAMPQLVWATDTKGRVTYFNERHHEFKGLKQNFNGTWDWQQMIHPEDLERTVHRWETSIETQGHFQIEHRLHCHDDSYRWFLTRAQAIRDGILDKIVWIGTTTNIDKLKHTEVELDQARNAAEQASLAKSSFVASMSHEIRTPMTVFLSALEYILSTDITPEQRNILKLADKAANSLRSIIDDILDFSRIESGKFELHHEAFDLKTCLFEIADMFSLQLREKSLDLKTDIAGDIPALLVSDQSLISQVLVNLLGNAIKFTEQGEITLAARYRDNHVEINVADTGCGLPEENPEEIFNSFCQGSTGRDRKVKGTGLGLAICKGLVDLLGGEISARNREQGGAVFTVIVPVSEPVSADRQPAKPAATVDRARKKTSRILLVEDDPHILELISMVLAEHGYDVGMADDGETALQKYRSGGYDLVLMDVQLPGINGLEVTRLIRSEESPGQHIAIIGCTAQVDRKTLDNCSEAGMDCILSKPLHLDELYRTIEHYLALNPPCQENSQRSRERGRR